MHSNLSCHQLKIDYYKYVSGKINTFPSTITVKGDIEVYALRYYTLALSNDELNHNFSRDTARYGASHTEEKRFL